MFTNLAHELGHHLVPWKTSINLRETMCESTSPSRGTRQLVNLQFLAFHSQQISFIPGLSHLGVYSKSFTNLK